MSAGSPSLAAGCLDATVGAQAASAADARSLKLDDGRVLRLSGIEPFTLLLGDTAGAENKLESRLSEFAAGKTLRVEIASEKPDRYGRLPALVTVAGSLLQETLTDEGLALAFAVGDPLPCFDRILAAEAKARSARRGFWSTESVPPATPEALEPRIGSFAIFEGIVLSVGTRRATTYLDFGRKWSEDVTIEIVAKERDAFGGEKALEKLAGARIRARGFLQEKAGPMLAVHSPMQLEILVPSGGERGKAP
jgi:Staphylococcal nuclease homologue